MANRQTLNALRKKKFGFIDMARVEAVHAHDPAVIDPQTKTLADRRAALVAQMKSRSNR